LAQNRPLEDDVDVWRYAMLELHARNDDDDDLATADDSDSGK